MTDFFKIAADNMLLAVGISFAGGVMTSLTPCVYPVILITVAVFGARQARSRLQAFLLSLTFASAIIIMYTSLGIVSALTGTLFGKIYTNRWFIVSIAALFVLMGLSLFGLFTIQLPESLRNRFAAAGKAGFAGAFVIGLVSGLLAAPCTGPVLIGILTFVSTTQSVGFGALLLLAYSLGLTLIFIVVGTFVMSLPKSGKWLDAVKDILGVVMLVLSIYFLRIALPLDRLVAGAGDIALPGGLAAAAAGLVLVILSHTFIHRRLVGDGEGTPGRRASFQAVRILAIVLFVSGASAAILSRTAVAAELDWIRDDEAAAMAAARQEKKPMVIDFTASWCESCLKIERETFSDGQVSKEMERFVLLRMDLSDMTEEDDAIQKKFNIGGLPTVLVMGSDGREASRITEFMNAEAFLGVLRSVR
jgi:thiol:disulfide interchange protein DsbD